MNRAQQNNFIVWQDIKSALESINTSKVETAICREIFLSNSKLSPKEISNLTDISLTHVRTNIKNLKSKSIVSNGILNLDAIYSLVRSKSLKLIEISNSMNIIKNYEPQSNLTESGIDACKQAFLHIQEDFLSNSPIFVRGNVYNFKHFIEPTVFDRWVQNRIRYKNPIIVTTNRNSHSLKDLDKEDKRFKQTIFKEQVNPYSLSISTPYTFTIFDITNQSVIQTKSPSNTYLLYDLHRGK